MKLLSNNLLCTGKIFGRCGRAEKFLSARGIYNKE
nr:MAG TPA: hypothetical protein [Caudoviricetes sp.]